MQYFNFSRLINKYSTEFIAVVPSERIINDAGEWVYTEPTREILQGAIISHRENKVFRSEGTLSEKDRALFMLEPLKFDLQGVEVIHEGNKYGISSKLENAKFTGVHAYTLKWISAFKEGGE